MITQGSGGPPPGTAAQQAATAGDQRTALPVPPALSPVGRQVLADAEIRDRILADETGLVWQQMLDELRQMDADERDELIRDGFRHRQCRRRTIESSNAISAALGNFASRHVSFAELQRRRGVAS